MDTKAIPLICTGFQAFIDNIFWYLPFSKQAADFLAKREMSDKHWIIKCLEISAEHKLERAPNNLKEGWKTWLKDNWPGQAKGSVALPVTGPVYGQPATKGQSCCMDKAQACHL